MTKKKRQLIILLGLLIIAVIAVTAFALIKNAEKKEEGISKRLCLTVKIRSLKKMTAGF